MAENTLLTAILNDYLARDAAVDPLGVAVTTEADAARKFCDFANDWLAKKGVVGVGQTTEGFSIRFADLSERVLFKNRVIDSQLGMPVSITGMENTRADAMPDSNRSFNITGN